MKNILVAYDLNKSGQNYDGLISYIKSYRVWAKINQSVWYIKSDKSATQIRYELSRYIDDNDSVFVAEMSAVSWFLPQEIGEYIRKNWS